MRFLGRYDKCPQCRGRSNKIAPNPSDFETVGAALLRPTFMATRSRAHSVYAIRCFVREILEEDQRSDETEPFLNGPWMLTRATLQLVWDYSV